MSQQSPSAFADCVDEVRDNCPDCPDVNEDDRRMMRSCRSCVESCFSRSSKAAFFTLKIMFSAI